MVYEDLVEDDLQFGDSEIEELDNDQLSGFEAGFLKGYDETEDDDFQASEEEEF